MSKRIPDSNNFVLVVNYDESLGKLVERGGYGSDDGIFDFSFPARKSGSVRYRCRIFVFDRDMKSAGVLRFMKKEGFQAADPYALGTLGVEFPDEQCVVLPGQVSAHSIVALGQKNCGMVVCIGYGSDCPCGLRKRRYIDRMNHKFGWYRACRFLGVREEAQCERCGQATCRDECPRTRFSRWGPPNRGRRRRDAD